MDNDRTAMVEIGGDEYALVLTTRATKEVSKRYGGLENLGDKLLKTDDFALAIDEVVWLLTLLANQGVQIHNLRNPKDVCPLLTEEAVELLTTPADLAKYKDAIMEAMYKGTARHIESEEETGKNVQAG